MNTLEEAIFSHEFFRGMKSEHLTLVSDGAREAKTKAGEVLFREGEPSNRFYLIQSGKVALEAHDPTDGTSLVQTVGAGEVLGWSWLFPPFTWHFQARVLEPMDAIVLSGAHLLAIAERNHDFGYELMKRVAQVLIHRLQATRKQLLAPQVESVLEG